MLEWILGKLGEKLGLMNTVMNLQVA